MIALSFSAERIAYPLGPTLFRDLALDIGKGEAVALLGGNGVGKSALLLAIAGLLAPEARRTVEGRSVRDVTEAVRGGLGLVLQDPDDQLLGPSLRDDVTFGPRNQGLSRDVAMARGRAALAATGIADLEERLVHTLSFGERKRAAVAAALAMTPRVLLLDEPTAGLDPRCEIAMAQLLASLRDGGTTLVVATHAVDLVPLYATRAIVLTRGGVAADGPCRDVFADDALLERAGLRRPWVAEVFRARGVPASALPLTLDEALHV